VKAPRRSLTCARAIRRDEWRIDHVKIWQDASQHRDDHAIREKLGWELASKLSWCCIAADSQHWGQLLPLGQLPLSAMVLENLGYAATTYYQKCQSCDHKERP